jgi:signal transduction histidine kinase
VVFADLAVAPDYIPWREAALKEGFVTSATLPLVSGNQVFGALNLYSDQAGFFSPERVAFFQTFAGQAATALQNARLFAETRQLYEEMNRRQAQLRELTAYLQTAREEERAYVAREIHDEFGQTLTALKMDLSWLARRLPQRQTDLAAKVNAMAGLVDGAVNTVRRIATELRPGLLDDLGLVAAIEWQAQEFARRTGLTVELHLGDQDLALDRDLATALFRIFQEALTNIARHAAATRVEIELVHQPDLLKLVVADNGKGIEPAQILAPRSLGLLGMRERARALGGDVVIEGSPGQGTTVTVRIP